MWLVPPHSFCLDRRSFTRSKKRKSPGACSYSEFEGECTERHNKRQCRTLFGDSWAPLNGRRRREKQKRKEVIGSGPWRASVSKELNVLGAVCSRSMACANDIIVRGWLAGWLAGQGPASCSLLTRLNVQHLYHRRQLKCVPQRSPDLAKVEGLAQEKEYGELSVLYDQRNSTTRKARQCCSIGEI